MVAAQALCDTVSAAGIAGLISIGLMRFLLLIRHSDAWGAMR